MFVVAGASGHVGSVVANELIAGKQQVKVIVRDAAKGAAWSGRGAEVALGALDDAHFLAGALKGATGFFVLLPPNYAAKDFFAEQRKVAGAIAAAVKQSGVPHVVMLSSIGADLPDKTGPIKGLHYLETVLRATGTRLTAIRAGSFQENAGNAIGPARAKGIYANFSASADYAFPQIATKDIGALAAKVLRDPPGKSKVIDLIGPAYSHRQIAEKIGAALGKKLQIVDVPPEHQLAALQHAGLPPTVAEAFVEMYAAFGTGIIQPKGDEAVHGSTTFDEVLPSLLLG